jgi:hypothetical protein
LPRRSPRCRGVQRRRVRRQRHEHDVLRHEGLRRTVRAGSVEDHPSDGARPRLSLRLYDTKCPIKSQLLQLMASMLTVGMTNAAPVPRAGQMKIEFGGDAVTQVGTAPADHAVGLGIRASSTHFATSAQLGFGQTRLTPRVREPRQAVGVVEYTAWRQRSAPPPPATAKSSDLGRAWLILFLENAGLLISL